MSPIAVGGPALFIGSDTPCVALVRPEIDPAQPEVVAAAKQAGVTPEEFAGPSDLWQLIADRTDGEGREIALNDLSDADAAAFADRLLAAIGDPEAEFSVLLTVAAHDVLRLDGRPARRGLRLPGQRRPAALRGNAPAGGGDRPLVRHGPARRDRTVPEVPRMTSAAEGILGPGPAPQATGKVKAFLRLVMIEHSVFALPFAYIAALSAMFQLDGRVHWGTLLLVTVCMVGLRTFAMAANRIIDREIDSRNPRTAGRELVTGAVSVRSAWTGAGMALVVFLGSAALLNPLCLALAPIAVVPMVVYPYGKRFTDFPHAILGLAQAMGPVGAWLAVTGEWSWDAVILGLAVGVWIGGFDLIFGSQDVAADRAEGVRSVPARFGVPAALWGRAARTW